MWRMVSSPAHSFTIYLHFSIAYNKHCICFVRMWFSLNRVAVLKSIYWDQIKLYMLSVYKQTYPTQFILAIFITLSYPSILCVAGFLVRRLICVFAITHFLYWRPRRIKKNTTSLWSILYICFFSSNFSSHLKVHSLVVHTTIPFTREKYRWF